MRRLRRAPAALQLLLGAGLVLSLWLAANGVYQVARKPTELFFPVRGTLNKMPLETWRAYGPLFRRYSTSNITPELLAALAQVEGAGNPVAHTYWRFSFRPKPFELYRPASSAVGMYQMTDATFAEASRYCIREHRVIAAGEDDSACWLNRLYFRVIPSHAVELTAAYLDVHIGRILSRSGTSRTSLEQKQRLAAVIHLCGSGAAELYAQRGFRFSDGERCGDHDPRVYLARVASMRDVFARLAARELP